MATNSNTEKTIDFDPISWESLRNELKQNEVDEVWLKSIDELINRFINGKAKSTKSIDEYMNWAKARKKDIKTNTAPIPSSTLGSNITQADLIDVRISCRGSDDALYDRDELLRKRLPRGCTLIEYKMKNESTTNLDFVIFALRKFSGGLGDDDDREENGQAWLRYFLKNPLEAPKIISTRKVNGEACHLSCIYLPPNNRLILIAGSKNVHLAFRTHNDLDRYSDGGMYTYAKPFCRLILDTLASMPDSGRKLINFLAMTRYTAVFEALCFDHQHIINLSYLKDQPHRSQLKFLTFSQIPEDFDRSLTSLCSLRPDFSIEIAKRLHLSTTDYDILVNEPDILNDHLRSIKYRPNCEGSVLYFVDNNDQVIGLLKKKTIWYVILRAIREKVRVMLSEWEKKHKLDSDQTITKTEGRLKAIQRWLLFSDEIHERWKVITRNFINWLAEAAKKKKMTRADIADRYPIVWGQFIEQTNNRDDFMFEISPAHEEIWKELSNARTENSTVTDSFTIDIDEDEEENVDEVE